MLDTLTLNKIFRIIHFPEEGQTLKYGFNIFYAKNIFIKINIYVPLPIFIKSRFEYWNLDVSYIGWKMLGVKITYTRSWVSEDTIKFNSE